MPIVRLDVDNPLIDQEIVLSGGEPFQFKRARVWQNFEGGNLQVSRSAAFVCPSCLNVWARSYNLGDKPEYQIVAKHCEGCGGELAGSLLDHDPVLLDYLPDLLLRREVALHFKWFDREEVNNDSTASDSYGASSAEGSQPSPRR